MKTSYIDSIVFAKGIMVFREYPTKSFSINLIEDNSILVEGIEFISEDNYQYLTTYGWKIITGKDNYNAIYSNLNYSDG